MAKISGPLLSVSAQVNSGRKVMTSMCRISLADQRELYLLFAVKDTGRGLDEKEKTLLFQRFSQASPRTHVQYGGSGLGLFSEYPFSLWIELFTKICVVSRELTELQGGEIGVSSERGVGSTFAFYIKARRLDHVIAETPIANTMNPLRRNASNSGVTFESRRSTGGKLIGRSNTTGSKRLPVNYDSMPAPLPQLKSTNSDHDQSKSFNLDHRQLRILIVEDNLVNQKVLQKQLINLGFMTEVANHGGEALEILKTSKFWAGKENDGIDLAVILMDLEMPIMDGLSCTRKIREFEADGTITKHVPIIAVTANARLKQIEIALTAGMVSLKCAWNVIKLMRLG